MSWKQATRQRQEMHRFSSIRYNQPWIDEVVHFKDILNFFCKIFWIASLEMYFSTHYTARNLWKPSHRQRIDDTDYIYHIYIIFHLLLHHLENKLLHGSRDSNRVCERYLLTITVRYIFPGAHTLFAPSKNTVSFIKSVFHAALS